MINIGAITTSRSDFGILSEILIRINSLKKYNLNLFVCGSHLNKNYGNTSKEIKKYIATKIINCKNIIFKNISFCSNDFITYYFCLFVFCNSLFIKKFQRVGSTGNCN